LRRTERRGEEIEEMNAKFDKTVRAAAATHNQFLGELGLSELPQGQCRSGIGGHRCSHLSKNKEDVEIPGAAALLSPTGGFRRSAPPAFSLGDRSVALPSAEFPNGIGHKSTPLYSSLGGNRDKPVFVSPVFVDRNAFLRCPPDEISL
jgi:hypothetical protein